MSTLDYCRAVAIGFAVFAGTLLLSIPLVAAYAMFINPGHPPEFYRGAAMWIAPWSSHLGGPMLFFWLTRRQTRRHPQTHPIAFAGTTIGSYAGIDLLSVPFFGLAFSTVMTKALVLSLMVKSAAALTGAVLGARRLRVTFATKAIRG
jgi:hypothetical protein